METKSVMEIMPTIEQSNDSTIKSFTATISAASNMTHSTSTSFFHSFRKPKMLSYSLSKPKEIGKPPRSPAKDRKICPNITPTCHNDTVQSTSLRGSTKSAAISDDEIFTCTICNITFPNRKKMDTHIKFSTLHELNVASIKVMEQNAILKAQDDDIGVATLIYKGCKFIIKTGSIIDCYVYKSEQSKFRPYSRLAIISYNLDKEEEYPPLYLNGDLVDKYTKLQNEKRRLSLEVNVIVNPPTSEMNESFQPAIGDWIMKRLLYVDDVTGSSTSTSANSANITSTTTTTTTNSCIKLMKLSNDVNDIPFVTGPKQYKNGAPVTQLRRHSAEAFGQVTQIFQSEKCETKISREKAQQLAEQTSNTIKNCLQKYPNTTK